jgi:hypothetical protein
MPIAQITFFDLRDAAAVLSTWGSRNTRPKADRNTALDG